MSGGPGLSSVYVESLAKGDESEYQYEVPKQGANVIRTPRFMYPENDTAVAGRSGPIRWKFNNNCPADFRRRSYLQMTVTITRTGGSYGRMAQLSVSAFNRLRYFVAGDTLDEKQNYNQLFSINWNALQDPTIESTLGVDLLGIGTTAQRNAWGLIQKRYWFPIDMDFLMTGVIPFNAFGTTEHNLEIFLEQPTAFIETDGTDPIVTFSDIQWQYDEVTSWDGSYEKDLIDMVQRGEYLVAFKTADPYLNNLTTTSQDLIISQRHMSIDYIINVVTDTNNQYVTTVNDKFMNHLKSFGGTGSTVQAFQFRVANKYFPDEEIDCTGDAIEAYQYYLGIVDATFLNTFGGNAPSINQDAFNDDNFLMVGDFRNNHGPQLLNNFSTETAATDIIFRIRLSVAPSAGFGITHWVYYKSTVQFLPNGKIIVRN
jgi:hypothetical protein